MGDPSSDHLESLQLENATRPAGDFDYYERMEKFAKLPPLNAKRNVPAPDSSSDTNPMTGAGSA